MRKKRRSRRPLRRKKRRKRGLERFQRGNLLPLPQSRKETRPWCARIVVEISFLPLARKSFTSPRDLITNPFDAKNAKIRKRSAWMVADEVVVEEEIDSAAVVGDVVEVVAPACAMLSRRVTAIEEALADFRMRAAAAAAVVEEEEEDFPETAKVVEVAAEGPALAMPSRRASAIEEALADFLTIK